MKTKITLLTLFALLLSFTSLAQRISLEAGTSFSKLSMGPKDEFLEDANFQYGTGYDIGIRFHQAIRENLEFAGGIFYSQVRPVIQLDDSYSETYEGITYREEYDLRHRFNMEYLRVPLTVAYIKPLEIGDLILKAGPSFSYGLSIGGTSTYEGKYYENNTLIESFSETETEEQESFSEYELNEFEAGLIVGTGLRIRQFSIEAEYRHGLTDFDPDDDFYSKHRGFQVKLGYHFITN